MGLAGKAHRCFWCNCSSYTVILAVVYQAFALSKTFFDKFRVMMQRAMHVPARRSVCTQLKLTNVEQNICNLLKDYSQEYNKMHSSTEPIVLRITGGWVRDKLLGFFSHDLDIAVNNMSGEQFAVGLSAYLSEHYEKYGITPHSIHKIDKNPEKSKHLETATTKLFGIEIDFVNLRSEEYTNESRIPVVAFGTPQQDALRRDATLNALFYNIQNDSIEDFTGSGLQDLQNGVLRTPLPPRQTFLDDPLRVLRLIRFASRLGFIIDTETYTAMGDPDINQAFQHKISRERVGVELHKILQGPDPMIGLKLIQQANLENVIFYWHSDPAVIEYNSQKTDMIAANDAYAQLGGHIHLVIQKLPTLMNALPQLQERCDNDPVFKQNFILCVILAPFRDIQVIWNPKKKMNNRASIVECIIKDGLKFGKNDSELVATCVDTHSTYDDMVVSYEQESRSKIGLMLRSFKGEWELAHYSNLALAYCQDDKSLSRYQSFHKYVFDEKLQDCHALKPLLDGKKLTALLNRKPGPWMKSINTEMIDWQLNNPNLGENELLAFINEILPKYT